MSEALVRIGQQELAQGGQGIDFSNPLFGLKPATLSINQRMTQAEDAIPGKLRIVETGDQFDKMTVALLRMPQQERQYYAGEAGQMNRTPDNLMCFSRDCQAPHAKAKVPQAMKCEGCARTDWTAWRTKKEQTGVSDKTLIPPCDEFYRVMLIDTVYRLPLNFYVRGGENKKAFEAGMLELARKFRLLQSQGHNLNIYDLQFEIGVKTGNAKTNYVLTINGKSFRMIKPEERDAFGSLYLELSNAGRKSEEETAKDEAEAEIEQTNSVIDAEVLSPGQESTNVIEGEIVI